MRLSLTGDGGRPAIDAIVLVAPLELPSLPLFTHSRARLVFTLPLTTVLGCSAPVFNAAPQPPPLAGEAFTLPSRAGALACYVAGPTATSRAPLLFVHSVNAAGSAYEVKPLYDHYRGSRRVYALELPGYGHSDRSERVYTLRMMTDAVLAATEEVRRREGVASIDALAVSLSSEFLARAASEAPGAYRSVALVSPTGFDSGAPYRGAAGSSRGKAWLYRLFTAPVWRRPFFDVLTTRASIRFFLEKTWGGKRIDEGMFEYAHLTTRHPGAHHVPYYFISGYLFSADITSVYETLRMPVWMSHGVRGDFVDYRYKAAFADRANWRFSVFDSGALPYFERPAEFITAYDNFLDASGSPGASEPHP